jgi:DNA polymerase-3 subunit gamma/tau
MAKKKTPQAPPTAEDRNYTVLARRYRPQQFSELVGQEPAAQALVNALKSNRVAHAYLFTGARGVGKTSTARILAKALNCEKGPTPTPCDQCESCRAIAAGEDMDVLEIDGASNTGVDDVRELRQNVTIRPSRSRFKVYIIDEVHMLSKSAFNALLKTLEEPPAHVKFIFATTEVQKIPVTILSRCQRFDFGGISTKRIHDRLREIVAEEGLDAEPEALELLARRAGGSMRDAQSLLDQVLAFGDAKVTVAQVHQLLGTANEDQVARLAAAVLDQDAAGALRLLHTALDEGVQLGEYLDQLMEYWRDLLLIKTAGAEFEGLSFPARFHDELQRQAQSQSLDALMMGLDLFAGTRQRLRNSGHGRTLAEMLLVRLSRIGQLTSVTDLVEQLTRGTPPEPASRPAAGMPKRPAEPSSEAALKKNAPLTPPPPADDAGGAPTPFSPQTLTTVWQRLLGSVGAMYRTKLEVAAPIATFAPNCLVLRFSSRYNKEREFCQEGPRAERLEELLRTITGGPVAVRFESVVEPGQPAADTRVPRMQQLRKAAIQEPLVRRAIEQLDAQLLPNIEDGFGTAPVPGDDSGDSGDDDTDV